MDENRSSISQATSYEEIGEFWDEHSLDEFWDQTEPVEFEVDIQSHRFYFVLDSKLVPQVRKVARQRGISSQTLLNLWIQEKLLAERGLLQDAHVAEEQPAEKEGPTRDEAATELAEPVAS